MLSLEGIFVPMKKLLFCIIALSVLGEISLAAWNKREHAAIAIIAENHLSPKAKRIVYEISGGHLAAEASYLDEHRKSMMPLQHLMRVDDKFQGELVPIVDSKGQKNALAHIQDCMDELKRYKELDDSTRKVDLFCIVHLIGDIHCPGHVIYSDGRSSVQWVKINYNGKMVKFHGIWDGPVTEHIAGGPLDLAYICDVASDKEISKMQEGSLLDWAQDIAVRCQDVNINIEPGQTIDKNYLLQNWPLAQQELMLAGYRLAKVLNDIFR